MDKQFTDEQKIVIEMFRQQARMEVLQTRRAELHAMVVSYDAEIKRCQTEINKAAVSIQQTEAEKIKNKQASDIKQKEITKRVLKMLGDEPRMETI